MKIHNVNPTSFKHYLAEKLNRDDFDVIVGVHIKELSTIEIIMDEIGNFFTDEDIEKIELICVGHDWKYIYTYTTGWIPCVIITEK